jgi:hypothetical protein
MFRISGATNGPGLDDAGVQVHYFHAAHSLIIFLYINKKFWEEVIVYFPAI